MVNVMPVTRRRRISATYAQWQSILDMAACLYFLHQGAGEEMRNVFCRILFAARGSSRRRLSCEDVGLARPARKQPILYSA